MATAKFKFDPMFEYNLLHWKGSLNPIGDRFRTAADKIARKVRSVATAESHLYVVSSNAIKPDRFKKSVKTRYRMNKAFAYSLRKYVELVAPIEVHGPHENYAAVVAGHAASVQMEFGGADGVIEVDGQHIVYRPMHILRRGLS